MSDYSLLTAAAKVKKARLNFAFFQGKKSNQVIISGRPAGPKQIADIEKDCGETKKVFKGVCFKENDQLVFATKSKPSMVWEVMLTKCFKEQKCTKFLPVELRQLKDNESDEVVAEETDEETPAAKPAPAAGSEAPAAKPAPAPATDSVEADWRKTKAEITPRVNNAIRANPTNRDELLGLVKQGLEEEKTGSFAKALSFFRQLEGKLPPPAPAGTPPPPPPPPGTPPPGGKALSASELSVAFKNVVPRLQQAVVAQPTRRAEILAPAAKFKAALDAGKLPEAQAAMMEALALIKTLAPAAPAANPAAEAAFTATWSKATKVWLDCVGTVDEQIEKIRAAMQGSGDSDFEEIAKGGLTALTDNHKTPVMVALREVNGASGDARQAAAAKAREAISSFRSHIISDERVAVCDEECEAEFGVKLTIRAEITRGLDELDAALESVPTP